MHILCKRFAKLVGGLPKSKPYRNGAQLVWFVVHVTLIIPTGHLQKSMLHLKQLDGAQRDRTDAGVLKHIYKLYVCINIYAFCRHCNPKWLIVHLKYTVSSVFVFSGNQTSDLWAAKLQKLHIIYLKWRCYKKKTKDAAQRNGQGRPKCKTFKKVEFLKK